MVIITILNGPWPKMQRTRRSTLSSYSCLLCPSKGTRRGKLIVVVFNSLVLRILPALPLVYERGRYIANGCADRQNLRSDDLAYCLSLV